MKLVIVESPAKAKVLEKYLEEYKDGPYSVLASYGHIRSIPRKKSAIDPNSMSIEWELSEKSEKRTKDILSAAKKCTELILATDLDREGEAIAWHICEFLREKGITRKTSRVTFDSITPKSIYDAMNNSRELSQSLVNAYLSRTCLDFLVGFHLSPLLWRKLPGSKSAGRVQSLALRKIVEREYEIENFIPQKYWTLEGEFLNENNDVLTGSLVKWQNKKIEKFMWTEKSAEEAAKKLQLDTYSLEKVEKFTKIYRPNAPFITSTLQQAASNILHWKADYTASIAQKLYEGVELQNKTVGLITYIRTDSVKISSEAIKECRLVIKEKFGEKYLPEKSNEYKSKVRNAQEAHEAIRPVDIQLSPDKLENVINNNLLKLYSLIWKQTVASQMKSAEYLLYNAFIFSDNGTWKIHGRKLAFDGFQKLIPSSTDTENEGIFENQNITSCTKVSVMEHETKPASRYSEAGLIKFLEESGVGRPSTYARILQILDERGYVKSQQRSLSPTERGWLVVGFLINYFEEYIEVNFTANVEEKLDSVARDKMNWQDVVQSFWKSFIVNVDKVHEVKIYDSLRKIENSFEKHFFDNRECPACLKGTKELKLGKSNIFIGCSRYPECNWIQKKASEVSRSLNPESENEIIVKYGPYGAYLEWQKTKKRLHIPSVMNSQTITLEEAKKLESLPIELGKHPLSNEVVKVGIGRFGPYVQHMNNYISIRKDDIFSLTLDECINLISESSSRKKSFSKSKFTKKTSKTNK